MTTKIDHEAEKVAIEREQLNLDRDRLASEERRAKWTVASVAVPLLAALATVAFGFWSTKETARLQFRLEAAKAAMSAPTPYEAIDRARLFQALFPDQLGWKIANVDAPDAHEIRSKFELFRVMTLREITPAKSLDLWIALFPGDEWAKNPEIKKAIGAAQSN